jgi:hypothetical protein
MDHMLNEGTEEVLGITYRYHNKKKLSKAMSRIFGTKAYY